MAETPFRLALVGAGPWAQRYAATVSDMPGVSLVASVSRALAAGTRSASPASAGAEIVAEVGALEKMAVDGVVVAVPPPAMADVCGALIEMRLPFLAEKPLTLSAAAARTIAEQAAAADVPAMVDLIYLFNPGYRALKAHVAPASLIEIASIGGNEGPFRDGVPALWDWGPHDVAMILDLVGADPVSVDVTRVEGNAQDHVVHANLSFASGLRASLSVGNRMTPKTRTLRCRTTAGDLIYDEIPTRRVRVDGVDIDVDPSPPLAAVVNAFVDCARGGNDPCDTLDLACRVNVVLEQIMVASLPKFVS